MALLILGVLVSFTGSGLAAEKVIKWKVQVFVPAGMLYHETLLRVADKVEKETGGRLVFDVYRDEG